MWRPTYLTRYAGIESLEETASLHGKDDVEIISKRLNRPGGSTTVGTDSSAVTSPCAGYAGYIMAESNLKLCVFYLKHKARVTHVSTDGGITLDMVPRFKDQQKWELDYKKTRDQ
jgi:hypothetical protein